jgi:hypothetical protein
MDLLGLTTSTLDAEHIDPDFDRPLQATARCAKLFAGMVGMEDIKGKFIQYQGIVSGLRERGHDPRPYVPFTYIFSGPPGTGKTTVARKLGHIFYDIGLLAGPDVIECSASDLVSGFVGGTGPKVVRMFERALGKVLFVDEAYRLTHYAEAVGEIVDCLTKERFYQKVVVILAGYPDDMDTLLRANRGMRSRFATRFVFSPMSPAHAIKLLRELVSVVDIVIVGLDNFHPAHVLLDKLVATKSWGNGREIETMSRLVVELAYAGKVTSTGEVVVEADKLVSILEKRLSEAYSEDRMSRRANKLG